MEENCVKCLWTYDGISYIAGAIILQSQETKDVK